MNILHVTNWYPTQASPYNALWIKRHIDSLRPYAVNKVYHVELTRGSFSIVWGRIEIEGNTVYRFSMPFLIWPLIELFSFWIVRFIIKKEQFDLINFHIAYPLCTYLHKLKESITTPIVISEHWSAYHYHFGIEGSRKLDRVKRIFDIPDKIITVSDALRTDIINFSSNDKLDISIVPNIVDSEVFYFEPRRVEGLRFFMVSQWKQPKDPFSVIRTLRELRKTNPDVVLRIGGYGNQENEIVKLISELELSDSVFFLGKLNSQQIAEEMRLATGFIHVSGYETFSVVCAEAICCGCPVLASAVGGIMEFIDGNNGLLINNEEWSEEVVDRFIGLNFDRAEISRNAHSRFSSVHVGALYYQALLKCL